MNKAKKPVCYKKEGAKRAGAIGGRAVPVDRMIEKARKLLESGKVERLDIGLFNVVGDHGTYVVVESWDGKISCNCPGFVSKGRCSHSVAVNLLKARSRHAQESARKKGPRS